MKRLVAVLAVVLVASPALAGTIATPYVAGGFQGWDPGSDPMTETFLGSDIWTATFTGMTAGAREEFKITDGTWDTTIPGANSWLVADAGGNVTITYDGNTPNDGWSPATDRIGVNTGTSGTGWTAVGDFQMAAGAAGNWNNAEPLTAMLPIGGGIYSTNTFTIPAGSYVYKATSTGNWDAIGSDSRSINAGNLSFTTSAGNDTVEFQVNTNTGAIIANVTPEPASIALLGLGGLALIRRRR